jgi:hypothetical protein
MELLANTLLTLALIGAFVWHQQHINRALKKRITAMAADIASISASLTKAQKTLDAIVASNPKPEQDLSGIQAQADSVAAAADAVAAALGVTVPVETPTA